MGRFLFGLLLCLNAGGAEDPRAKADAALAVLPASRPGCAASVILDGKLVYTGARGVLRRGYGPLTARTKFLLASNTKSLVSLSVLKLRELYPAPKGDLLSATLALLFPELRFRNPALGALTVGRLLQHQAGLYRDIDSYHIPRPLSDRRVVEALARIPVGGKALIAPQGRGYLYSNVGYAVLGAVVEKVSGRSLTRFMEEHWFRPLGMKHTSIRHPRAYVGDPAMATGHFASGPQPLVDSLAGTLGDGGAVSTAEDMAKLALGLEAIEDGRSLLLRADSLRLAFTAAASAPEIEAKGGSFQNVVNAKGETVYSNYAMGWSVYPRQPGATIGVDRFRWQWHGGYYGGYRSMFQRGRRERPACRIGVTVLCNQADREPSPGALADSLTAIFCPP